MFGYLRVFVMVSLAAVVIIALLVGFYLKFSSTNDLTRIAESQNMLIANSYKQAVWSQAPYPQGLTRIRKPELAATQEKAFKEASEILLNALQVKYFSIYDQAGEAIYRHDREATNITNINEEITHLRSSKKNTVSIIDRQSIQGPNGNLITVKTLSKLDPNNRYYIETHHDITEAYWRILLMQGVTSGSIIIVFLLLMWILIQTSKRAEQIIVQQHESNTELAAKAAVAESENKQKSMFLANISHELRTPLNAIIGFSQIIQQEGPGKMDQEKFGNYINDIHNSGVHLLSLINDILDFSKAEAGKLEIDVEELNLSKMVKNCLRLVATRAEEEGVILVDSMPKETIIMHTDSKKLKQILLNLLSNAVKFTPTGGEVRVSGWRNIADDTIGFEVSDSGIGMAAKDISRAISPFGQIDSALSRKYEGTGLGLPLTKKITELMGGTFRIESELGKGTSITITLPREYDMVAMQEAG